MLDSLNKNTSNNNSLDKDDKDQIGEKAIDELCSIGIWTKEQEELLAEWCEKAQCYRWLHSDAERKFKRGHFAFTVPIIIMSTLTGTANFAVSSYVPEQYISTAQIIIGGVNIFSGILSTLQNFLRYAENNEAHRSAGILWSKFGRNIKIELSLDRIRRKNASDFLKIYRSEYDRLIEQSPLIPTKTINKFKSRFKKEYKEKKIHVPDICNGLEKCPIYQTNLKEEKISKIVASAANKLKLKKSTKDESKSKIKINI
tara:strand:+ start:2008 stop:2778 length:771 start_codon:yes stop_codon:yes gene_type:complete